MRLLPPASLLAVAAMAGTVAASGACPVTDSGLTAAPAAAAITLAAHTGAHPASGHAATTPVKHFIFLMQGGRTFDNYFGTYPGADGFPAGACEPRGGKKLRSHCVKPFSLDGTQPLSLGATQTIITHQYDAGKMDGFVSAYDKQSRDGAQAMGYYDGRSLPFYWGVARDYVLFDHFFSATLYGPRSNRSYWVSATPSPGGTERIPAGGYGTAPTIFDRLQAAGVSWKFYVQDYNPHQTYQSAPVTSPDAQTVRVPLLNYARFTHDPALRRHIVGLDQYYKDLRDGTLPAVAYIASSSADERSARSITSGQRLVSELTTQLMLSHYWDSSALMWSYDGSGGWYDNVRPPRVAGARLGLRVPALLVSAYAKKGQVNHTVLDYMSALRFIEQNWRLAPLTKRDASANSLGSAFDFAAGPRPAALLPPVIPGPRALQSAHGPHTALVYALYGVAGALAVLLWVSAAYLPAMRARRRARRAPLDGPQRDGPRTARRDATIS